MNLGKGERKDAGMTMQFLAREEYAGIMTELFSFFHITSIFFSSLLDAVIDRTRAANTSPGNGCFLTKKLFLNFGSEFPGA